MTQGFLLNALILLGLRREDLNLALVLVTSYLDSGIKSNLHQITTTTLRAYIDLPDVGAVQDSLERLLNKGVVFVETIEADPKKQKERLTARWSPLVYVVIAKKVYIFNPLWKQWIPNPGSAYYDIVRALGLPPRETTLAEIVSRVPVGVDLGQLMKNKPKLEAKVGDTIVPYTIYESFGEFFKSRYNRPYDTKFKARDLGHCKVLLETIRSRKKYPDAIYSAFLKWVFGVKSREARYGVLNCGILPYLWEDYESHEAMKYLQSMGSYLNG